MKIILLFIVSFGVFASIDTQFINKTENEVSLYNKYLLSIFDQLEEIPENELNNYDRQYRLNNSNAAAINLMSSFQLNKHKLPTHSTYVNEIKAVPRSQWNEIDLANNPEYFTFMHIGKAIVGAISENKIHPELKQEMYKKLLTVLKNENENQKTLMGSAILVSILKYAAEKKVIAQADIQELIKKTNLKSEQGLAKVQTIVKNMDSSKYTLAEEIKISKSLQNDISTILNKLI
jgi:hypothetical protein